MNRENSHISLLLFIIDFILLNFSFFLLNYLKRGTLKLKSDYLDLLILFYAIWICVSLLTRKFKADTYKKYFKGLFVYLKAIIFYAYIISFIVVVLGLASYSRVQIFGTCTILLILELGLLSIYFLSVHKKTVRDADNIEKEEIEKKSVSAFLAFIDFMLFSFAFFLMNYFKRGTAILPADYQKILLVLFGLWLFFSFITHKFEKHNFQNYYFALATCIKSVVFMGATLALLIFALRLFYFSRLQLFGTLLIFFFGEIFLYYFYFVSKLSKNHLKDLESAKEIIDFLEQKELPICETRQEGDLLSSTSFMKILRERCMKAFPQLFEFVASNIDLSEVKDTETAVMSSVDIINIEILSVRSLRLLINLHRTNDIRWINRYFLEIHKQLANGGYFIGRAETIEIQKRRFFKKYPEHLAQIFYLLHFIFFRVFPKLSVTKKIYFFITKGKGRVISRAEILGRLYFCGFKVIAEQELSEGLFFIAQKVKTPSVDLNPTYGLLVKLRRMGLNGQPIQIYKFRTMYPYSEYLQEYIYQHHNLKEGGKIKDDFRVTEWGKIMRKYWIDELPMIYNWIGGEIKLFGVRPLSKHYLSLYDRRLRRIRKMVKPGLIPPYYADLPKRFQDIEESEKRYILAYFKNPFKTQIIYLWKALNNIIFKGARTN